MAMKIATIQTGIANCYLLESGGNYCMIDTGFAKNRTDVLLSLEKAGCRPGNLKLIVITHADSDHTGNCRHLQQQYGAKIALHRDEVAAAESGDGFKNRTYKNSISRMVTRLIMSFLKLKASDRFTPDLIISNGDDLAKLGFDAKILHLPGHSNGSIGVVTAEGDLFCGDLIMIMKRVTPGFGIFDWQEFKANIATIKKLNIKNIYPGHGKPLTLEQLKGKRFS